METVGVLYGVGMGPGDPELVTLKALRVMRACDVLVLPTLSENFGLVIAEALERGKCVITTDGAPTWCDGNTYGGRLVYLKGYRDGTAEMRVRLLKDAIEKLRAQ